MLTVLRFVRLIVPLTALLVVLGLFGAQAVLAGGVIGNGTPGSCTETAFDMVYASGGLITFNCGSAVKTIQFSTVKPISNSLTINGANKIILKENNANHFQVSFGTTLTLKNITLSHGDWSQGGSVENHGTLKLISASFKGNHSSTDGGAIWNEGTLNVKKSTFTNNSSENSGGAIFNDGGTVTVTKSTFTGNKAKTSNNYGGAIENKNGALNVSGSTFSKNSAYNGGAIDSNATTIIDTSTFDKNTATNWGGAITALAGGLNLYTSTVSNNQAAVGAGLASTATTLNIAQSTFSGNTSTGDGGALYLSGIGSTQTVTNVTISGNHSSGGEGGGIFQHYGNVTLNFVTIANNTALAGAGIHKDDTDPTPSVMNVINTVLSNNQGATEPANCSGVPTSLGHNLSSDTHCAGLFTGPGDKNNKNPKLGALAHNGGPTMTHLPQTGSPLINKGTSYNGVTNDQRNLTRPAKGGFDIGAVEVQ